MNQAHPLPTNFKPHQPIQIKSNTSTYKTPVVLKMAVSTYALLVALITGTAFGLSLDSAISKLNNPSRAQVAGVLDQNYFVIEDREPCFNQVKLVNGNYYWSDICKGRASGCSKAPLELSQQDLEDYYQWVVFGKPLTNHCIEAQVNY